MSKYLVHPEINRKNREESIQGDGLQIIYYMIVSKRQTPKANLYIKGIVLKNHLCTSLKICIFYGVSWEYSFTKDKQNREDSFEH